MRDQIDDAAEALGAADGQLDGNRALPCSSSVSVAQRRPRSRRRSRSILVTKPRRGSSSSSARAQILSASTLAEPAAGSRTITRPVQARMRVQRVGQEVGVAGGVDQGDLVFLPRRVVKGRRQAQLAARLLGLEIEDGAAVVDAAQTRHRAGVEEDGFGERGLAPAALTDDADVAYLGDILNCHTVLPLTDFAANLATTPTRIPRNPFRVTRSRSFPVVEIPQVPSSPVPRYEIPSTQHELPITISRADGYCNTSTSYQFRVPSYQSPPSPFPTPHSPFLS